MSLFVALKNGLLDDLAETKLASVHGQFNEVKAWVAFVTRLEGMQSTLTHCTRGYFDLDKAATGRRQCFLKQFLTL